MGLLILHDLISLKAERGVFPLLRKKRLTLRSWIFREPHFTSRFTEVTHVCTT